MGQISIWLSVDGTQRDRFRSEVDKLAAAHDLPTFEPHITLVSDFSAPLDLAIEACEKVLARQPIASGRVAGADETAARFMSLFLDIQLSADLKDMRDILYRELVGPEPTPFRPHLSLAYGLAAGTHRSELRGELAERYHGLNLSLANVELWESSETIPVADWRRLWSSPLKQVDHARR